MPPLKICHKYPLIYKGHHRAGTWLVGKVLALKHEGMGLDLRILTKKQTNKQKNQGIVASV